MLPHISNQFLRPLLAMAWTAKDFVQELQDVEKLLAFKAAPVLQDSLLTALLKKIDSSNGMLPSDYVIMLDAVAKSGLDDAKKSWLQEKLMEKAASGEANAKGNKIVKSPQSLLNISAYLTESELQQLMTGEITKAPHLIVQRLRMAGVTSIKEDTKKNCVAMLVQAMLWHGMQMPDGDYTYMLATQFTSLFQASKIESQVPPMKVYPDKPTEMGEEWIKKVYGDEKPSLKTLPQLPEIASKVCVRSTNSNLSQNSKKRLMGKQSSTDFGPPADFIEALRNLVSNPSSDAAATASKAMKLTIFNHQPSPQKALAAPDSAVAKLGQRKQMGQTTSPAKAALALGNVEETPAETSPESAPSGKNASPQDSQDQRDGQKETKEKKSLEDYEMEAMEMLLKRPAAAHMKKPAKSSSNSSSTVPKLKRTVFGCLRCRGTPAGCDTCRSESFNGQRFEGRADYLKFVKAQAAKGKVYK